MDSVTKNFLLFFFYVLLIEFFKFLTRKILLLFLFAILLKKNQILLKVEVSRFKKSSVDCCTIFFFFLRSYNSLKYRQFFIEYWFTYALHSISTSKNKNNWINSINLYKNQIYPSLWIAPIFLLTIFNFLLKTIHKFFDIKFSNVVLLVANDRLWHCVIPRMQITVFRRGYVRL